MTEKRVLLKSLLVLALVGLVFVYYRSGDGLEPSQQVTPVASEGDFPDLSGESFSVEIDDHPSYGNILIDQEGNTLYTFAKDREGESMCTGECASNWPPFTVASEADLSAPEKVQENLGVSEREDGSLQVTFKESPLYYYSGDSSAGEVSGHGLDGNWFVVTIENPY